MPSRCLSTILRWGASSLLRVFFLNVAHDDVLDIDRESLLARAHTHTCTVDLPPKVRNSYRKKNSWTDPNLGNGCAIVRSIRTRTNAAARLGPQPPLYDTPCPVTDPCMPTVNVHCARVALSRPHHTRLREYPEVRKLIIRRHGGRTYFGSQALRLRGPRFWV
jgi:hypothetical protein